MMDVAQDKNYGPSAMRTWDTRVSFGGQLVTNPPEV